MRAILTLILLILQATAFSELSRRHRTRPLYMSPSLVQMGICGGSIVSPETACSRMTEWFSGGGQAEDKETMPLAPVRMQIEWLQPTDGLHLARDPRIPDDREALRLALSAVPPGTEVRWFVDDIQIAKTTNAEYLWPLVGGPHRLRASIDLSDPKSVVHVGPITVFVK
jgi:penicillin-binding protein 1C